MDQRRRDIKQVDAQFDGVTVIFFGDLFQLKPLRDGPIFCSLTESALKHAAFHVSVWKNYRMIDLTEIMRQNDRDWIEFLNRVRLGKQDATDLSRINQLVGRTVPPNTHLACHLRRNAQKFNEQHLAKVQVAQFAIAQSNVREHASCSKDIRQQLLDRAKEISLTDPGLTGSFSYSFPLALNQYFMIIVNMDKEDGLVNGSLSVLKAVSSKHHKKILEVPELLWLDLDDKSVGKAAREKYQTTHRSKVEKHWTPIKKVVSDFPVGLSNRLGRRFRVEWRQFPVLHAQGVTIHKFQGATKDHLELCFQSQLKVHGLAYVGLSRCRTEFGNSLVASMTNQDFRVDSDVLDEHERLVKAGFDFCLRFPHLSSAQFRCLFHNFQSIHAHFADIRSCILYATVTFLYSVKIG